MKKFPPILSLRGALQALVLLVLLGSSSCIRNRDYVLLQSPAEQAYWETSPLRRNQLRKAEDALRSGDSAVFVPYRDPEKYLIQFNDILRVEIRSYDEKANQIFNNALGQQMMGGNMMAGGGDPFFFFGNPVNDSGYLDLPVVGQIKVSGLSLEQAQQQVQAQIEKYFSQVFVRVTFGGIRFAVMGEVRSPNKFVAMQNRLTVLEALSMAGGLLPEGNRRRVQLIRQYPGGSRVVYLDLTDRRLLESPYYFVRPNDVLHVTPLRVREWGSGVTAQQSMGTVLTAISLLVNSILLYNTLRNL
ncbi:MAG: polysaccharide biosynthesis/export family protein [Bacteroidota bacterium]